jgi:hypothetical protein
MKRILALVLLLTLTSCGMEYSDGQRIGTLYKFSKKGLFCKTWEGTLKTGYLKATDSGVTSEEFKFAVVDESLVPKVQELLKREARVEVLYSEKAFTGFCDPDSDYWIKDIKEIK